MLDPMYVEMFAKVILFAMTAIGVFAVSAPFWMFDQSENILDPGMDATDNYEKSLSVLSAAGGALAIASLTIGFMVMNGGIKRILDEKSYSIYLTICAFMGIVIVMSAMSVNTNINKTDEAKQINDGLKPSRLMDLVAASGTICLIVAFTFMFVIYGYQSSGVMPGSRVGARAGTNTGKFGFDFEF